VLTRTPEHNGQRAQHRVDQPRDNDRLEAWVEAAPGERIHHGLVRRPEQVGDLTEPLRSGVSRLPAQLAGPPPEVFDGVGG